MSFISSFFLDFVYFLLACLTSALIYENVGISNITSALLI